MIDFKVAAAFAPSPTNGGRQGRENFPKLEITSEHRGRAQQRLPRRLRRRLASSKRAAAAGNKVAGERGQREAQSCGTLGGSHFVAKAEPPPRGTGPCASAVAQYQTSQAATHALPPPRPGVAFAGPRPPARAPQRPYPPANRCTSVSLWLILSSACPPGAEAGRGPSRPPRPAARAKKGDAGEWADPPLRKATREPTPRGFCSRELRRTAQCQS